MRTNAVIVRSPRPRIIPRQEIITRRYGIEFRGHRQQEARTRDLVRLLHLPVSHNLHSRTSHPIGLLYRGRQCGTRNDCKSGLAHGSHIQSCQTCGYCHPRTLGMLCHIDCRKLRTYPWIYLLSRYMHAHCHGKLSSYPLETSRPARKSHECWGWHGNCGKVRGG